MPRSTPAALAITALALAGCGASSSAKAPTSSTATTTALAAAASLNVSSAPSAKLGGQVLVDARGRTLYELSPETASHLLCRSSQCLGVWPPVSVRSHRVALKAAAGVHGRLATLTRSGGALQLTLSGHPLYRFAGDRGAGEANGQGLRSFGGTWHAVATSTPAPATTTTPSTPAPTTTSAPSEPAYKY